MSLETVTTTFEKFLYSPFESTMTTYTPLSGVGNRETGGLGVETGESKSPFFTKTSCF